MKAEEVKLLSKLTQEQHSTQKKKRRKKQSQLYKQDNNLRGFGMLCQNNIGQDKINGRSSRENYERKNKGMLKRKDSQ